MVVDDCPSNIKYLIATLSKEGYDVEGLRSGPEVLEKIEGKNPDLILLDTLMPKMSGYDVCRLLKQEPSTWDIAVIFLTIGSQIEDIVRGFELGAVDYLMKPINKSELLVRVKTHISLIQNYSRLNAEDPRLGRHQEGTTKLQHPAKMLKQTQDEHIQSKKVATLGKIVAGVAHELATPLGIVNGNASFLQEKTQEIDTLYKAGKVTESAFIDYLKLAVEASDGILRNVANASRYFRSFKRISTDQASEQAANFSVKDYIDDILVNLHYHLKKTKHRITIHCDENLSIESYPGAFSQIVNNLVLNTIEHAFESDQKGEILFDIGVKGDRIIFIYRDNGKGMDESTVKRVFDPFFTTIRERGGSGMGMYIVYNLVVKTLHGSITCESRPGEGVEFTIAFPKNCKR